MIARDLVQGHGGEITLHKSDELGTTFRLAFPSNIHEIMGAAAERAAG